MPFCFPKSVKDISTFQNLPERISKIKKATPKDGFLRKK